MRPSWNVKRPIPEAIIAKLEQTWPDVILSLGAHNHPTTDTRSLYSPLLRSLSFCILNHTASVTATRQLEQHSKLPELLEILLRSPSLRKLDIKFEYNWLDRKVVWTGIAAHPRVLNLPLQPSDRLPPLQELSFSGPPETYEFTLEHCRLWKQCMDWSYLRHLDLGISCPQHFFKELGSCLTSLRSLTMGVRIGSRRFKHWSPGPLACDYFSVVHGFVTSIPELYELNLTDFTPNYVDIFNLIETKGGALRKLYYHASIDRARSNLDQPYVLYLVAIGKISELPELRQLTFDFPLLDGHWVCFSSPVEEGFNADTKRLS